MAQTLQPESISIVPFIRDAKFIDRESIVNDLDSGFTENQRVALIGLVGAWYDDLVVLSKVVSDRL